MKNFIQAMKQTLQEQEADFAPIDELEEAFSPILESEDKIFRCRSTILVTDLEGNRQNEIDFKKKEPFFENPVPLVVSVSEICIGFADLSWHGDRLEAEISIPYSSPERLAIETDKVWAECGFSIDKDGRKWLKSLFFTHRQPRDGRETPLSPVRSNYTT